MTDEDDQNSDKDSSPEGVVAAWLVGDRDEPPPEIADTVACFVSRRFAERLREDPSALLVMLERLSTAGDAEPLLATILSAHWSAIRDGLPSFPALAPSARSGTKVEGTALATDAISPLLAYLLVSLAPDDLTELDVESLRFISIACAFDLSLLRHILTWASSQPLTNDRMWKFNDRDDAPPATIWEFVAQTMSRVFGMRRSQQVRAAWSGFDWGSIDGTRPARQVISRSWDELTADLRRHGRRVFRTHTDLAIELAKLDRALARQFAAESDLINEFAKAVPPGRLDPRSARQQSQDRTETVLQLLPLEQLGDQGATDERLKRQGRARDDLRDPFQMERQRQILAVGCAIGSLLHAQDSPRTAGSVAHLLGRWSWSESDEPTIWVGLSLLWADLLQLVEYEQKDSWKHQSHIRGVLARLSENLGSFPCAWATLTPELLRQAETLGSELMSLLTLGAAQHDVVGNAVKRASQNDPDRAVRDLARGVYARACGDSTAHDDFGRWLADSAARAFDGIPLFPHPLSPLTKTWLGSSDIEDSLARALRQAMVEFGGLAKDHGAAQEEHLTGTLMRDLENAFRRTSLRMESGGRSRLARTISVSHRPVLKSEEKQWGCDVALLLDADASPSLALHVAELVQVKKSEAFAAKRPSAANERWRIDVPQLIMILTMSESSAYWLILSTGELLCVPARWLYGLARGRCALSQRSVTVGYNDVRNAAIPMEQFIPELFLGTWVGSTNETTLGFAAGTDTNLSPRHIFEITVRASYDQ